MVKNYLTLPLSNQIENIIDNGVTDAETKSSLKNIVAILQNPFKNTNTEYKLNKYLDKSDLLCPLIQHSINDEVDVVSSNGEAIYDIVSTKGVQLSLRFQMKHILEKVGIPSEIDESALEPTIFSSFVNGQLWHEKIRNFPNSVCLPYFLYFDEFEINNCLGTHSDGITGIYFSFPFLEGVSPFENVFIGGFIKSEYFRAFGNDKCLGSLIEEIKFLEKNGIVLNLPSGETPVTLILGLIVGDNLGVNSICDLSRSFSATHYCRFCTFNKNQAKFCSKIPLDNKRTIENYNSALLNLSFKQSGIQKNSIFNSIPSFHVMKNYFVDLMHDVYEGICHYNLTHVLNYYINKIKLFSLETFNRRKLNFHYGPIDKDSISGEITLNDIKNKKLKMSGNEMKCFIKYFPLIIGDLITQGDEVWQFLINFLNIIDILLSKAISNEKLLFLSEIIEQHLNDYVRLFDDSLKPKHHLLIHYPEVIKYSGVPTNYWCFPFEAKHKEIKSYARVTNSRKNICLTLGKKAQLSLSSFLTQPVRQSIVVESSHEIKSKYHSLLCTKFDIEHSMISGYSKIHYNGTIKK